MVFLYEFVLFGNITYWYSIHLPIILKMENNNNVNLGLKSCNSLKNVEFYLYRRGRHARALCLYLIPPLSSSFFLSSLSPFFFLFSLLSPTPFLPTVFRSCFSLPSGRRFFLLIINPCGVNTLNRIITNVIYRINNLDLIYWLNLLKISEKFWPL